MKIGDFCSKLDAALTAKPAGPERFALVAQALCQAFRLQPDEIALLIADRDADVLRFAWPARLAQSGTIPLSSRDSLAVKTLRENKPIVNNRFASTYHASIFEQIKHDPKVAERPLPIQKILSVPLPGTAGAVGVVQISRKAAALAEAGADFSQDEGTALGEIATVIAAAL